MRGDATKFFTSQSASPKPLDLVRLRAQLVPLPRSVARTLLADAQHRENLILQPNDSLVVPEYSPVVRVEGAVVTQTDVLYRPGSGVTYYIENAGGFARNADEGRITVRYANGAARIKRGFLFFASGPRPEPGSLVTVAAKPDPEPFNVTHSWGRWRRFWRAPWRLWRLRRGNEYDD
jgi:hypothetical protein